MKITDQAKGLVEKVLSDNNASALRVQIVAGCCGPSVSLTIANLEDDKGVVDVNGVKVLYVDDALAQTESVVLAEKEGQLYLDNPNASC